MRNKSFIRVTTNRLSDLVPRALLIDDEHETNGWGKVLNAIFAGQDRLDEKCACVATIEDGIRYITGPPARRPLVFLDLLLGGEQDLASEELIEAALRKGESNWRRLSEVDRLLPILWCFRSIARTGLV